MDLELCPVCLKALDPDSYSRWCGRKCKDQATRQRTIREAHEAMELPLVTLPPDIEAQLPQGAESVWAAYRFLLVARAPAGARGYRLGTMRSRSRTIRYWPPSSSRNPAMFLLEPFERFVVPRRGRYVVLYVDGNGTLMGNPRFTILINHRERYLRFSDGDRSSRPRRQL